MGWTVVDRQVTKKNILDFLKAEFRGYHEIVDSSIRNNIAYLAVKSTKTQEVSGYVVLLSLKRDETGYKDMHECEGPIYFGAPKRILKKLSPTYDLNSLAWRFGCLKKPNYYVYDAFRRVLA